MTLELAPGQRPERPPFSPLKISPSRVNSYVSCGHAFKLQYVDRIPSEGSGSAALFGSVVHLALEWWAVDRTQDLVTLMAKAWVHYTKGTPVADFLAAYQGLSVEVMVAEKEARESFEKRNPGKESKAPRMTKEFKDSAACKKLNRLLAQWIPKLDAESPWKFNERDPLPSLYDESLIAAKKYMLKYCLLPAALYTEFEFNVEWEGFQLNGHIDTIEPLLNEAAELFGLFVGDYKTYRQIKAEQKDWRQVAIYDVAVKQMLAEGRLELPDVPIYVGVDYFRLGFRRDWLMTEADHAQLKTELDMYLLGTSAGVYLPAEKNKNPDFCDYPPELCCMHSKGAGCAQRGGIYTDPEGM